MLEVNVFLQIKDSFVIFLSVCIMAAFGNCRLQVFGKYKFERRKLKVRKLKREGNNQY
jgi:hypothetical protein